MAKKTSKGKNLTQMLSDINRDIKALDSSILIISQKLKHMARNEKILGRNLIVLNKKVTDLRKQVQQGVPVAEMPEGVAAAMPAELPAELRSQLVAVQSSLSNLNAKVEAISGNYVKAEEFEEVKYLVESIDPLKFVTVDQLKSVLGGKAAGFKARALSKPKKKAKAKKPAKKAKAKKKKKIKAKKKKK